MEIGVEQRPRPHLARDAPIDQQAILPDLGIHAYDRCFFQRRLDARSTRQFYNRLLVDVPHHRALCGLARRAKFERKIMLEMHRPATFSSNGADFVPVGFNKTGRYATSGKRILTAHLAEINPFAREMKNEFRSLQPAPPLLSHLQFHFLQSKPKPTNELRQLQHGGFRPLSGKPISELYITDRQFLSFRGSARGAGIIRLIEE